MSLQKKRKQKSAAKNSDDNVTIILADPPWTFKVRSKKGEKKSPKYSVMSIDDIAALGQTVRDMAGKRSMLFMWTTTSQLENSLRVMADWGYSYKTARVWAKSRVGTGYYVRCDAEILLIGSRGKVCVPAGVKERTIFTGKPIEKKHSSKPECIHQWLERGYPGALKIELFARKRRDGWMTYGDELGSLITKEGIKWTRLTDLSGPTHTTGQVSAA